MVEDLAVSVARPHFPILKGRAEARRGCAFDRIADRGVPSREGGLHGHGD
jgi:hypothetical protein